MNKYDDPNTAALVGHMLVAWSSPMALTLTPVICIAVMKD